MTPRLVCLDLRNGIVRPLRIPPPPTVLCLGNFDGVHLAHAALLREGLRLTERVNITRGATVAEDRALCGVFCFFRPSGDYFLKANTHPTHLTTLKERIAAIRDLGAELLWLCDFPTVRELSPTAFVELLRHACGCVGTVCGYNHRFGQRAEGTPELLSAVFGANHTVVLPALEIDGAPVSSSRIRAYIQAGDVEGASRLLGRPYFLETTVRHGKALAHTWGLPTANQIFPSDRLIPAHGVYAVRCHTPDGVFPGVANIGTRPTVDSSARGGASVNCETHIVGYDGNLYGRRLKVEFLKFLRPEQKFHGVDELISAIQKDAQTAVAYVTSLDFPTMGDR